MTTRANYTPKYELLLLLTDKRTGQKFWCVVEVKKREVEMSLEDAAKRLLIPAWASVVSGAKHAPPAPVVYPLLCRRPPGHVGECADDEQPDDEFAESGSPLVCGRVIEAAD